MDVVLRGKINSSTAKAFMRNEKFDFGGSLGGCELL
jgi:hypothetical protein